MGSTQVLARGRSFALFRTPLGHVAVVGSLRDGFDIEISAANVDLAPVRSPCLVVDCTRADDDARNVAVTIMDWVLARTSIVPEAEVWLAPGIDGERRTSTKLRERAGKDAVTLASTESEAIGTIMRVRRDRTDTDVGIRWSALLHAARSEAAREETPRTRGSRMPKQDELLLRSAIGEIRESIVVTDGDLDAPGPRIVYVNRAFTEITGYAADEVLGQSPRLLQGPRTDRALLRRMRVTLERGDSFEGETFNYRKDGAEFSMQWSVHPLRDEAGRVVRYFAIQRDVTEQRRYEAIARAVNMTDNIGMIFSGIRHELGNPVNSMKTALSVLRRQHRTFGPDKTDSYLERIIEEVSRVEFLLSSLRSYTAFERAKNEDVDTSAYLRNFARLVRGDLEARGIGFEIHEEPALPRMRVDPRALHQVLLNLVSNACDALVDVEVRRIRILASAAPSHVRLVVRDSGCGMSPEHLARLFVPFHTTKERGTGLGLVIAQKLVSAMGGHLQVTSERRKGTDVTIELVRGAGLT